MSEKTIFQNAQMQFGQVIKAIRQSRGKSLRSVAIKLGISPTYMEDVEKCRRLPPVGEKLRRIVEFYACDEYPDWLLYKIVGENRGELSPDLIEYLRRNNDAVEVVRKMMLAKNK